MSAPAGPAGEADVPPDPWRYRIRVPPLALPRYARASALILRPFTRGPGWRGLAPVVAASVLVGGAGSLVLGRMGAGLVAALYAERPPFAVELDGLDGALLLVGFVLLTSLVLCLLAAAAARRFRRRIHAATRTLNAENDLLLGEDGLEWRSADSSLFVRWAGVAALVPDGDTHLLRLDGVNFVWLPDAAMGDAGRRAEILAFVADRIARAAPP